MSYEMVDNYINYITNNKGKSLNTAKAYNRDLNELHIFLVNKYHNPELNKEFYNSISLIDLDSFMVYLKKEKNNSPASRNRKGIAVREFFKYLKRIKYVTEDIAEDLELPKIPQRLHISLTLEEAVKIIDVANNKGNKFRSRDTCILMFFLTTGLRVSELCNIKLDDIQGNVLKVIVKGDKQRKVFLSDSVLKILNEYLEYREANKLDAQEYLFVSKNGKQLKTSDIDYMVKKYAKKADINKKISAHKLRHSFASISYNNGKVDIRSLQELLGHKNISTTQIYTNVNDDMLEESINKNPITHIF